MHTITIFKASYKLNILSTVFFSILCVIYVTPFKIVDLVLVTHYVLITEVLNYAPSSGEIVISDIKFKKIGSIEIKY